MPSKEQAPEGWSPWTERWVLPYVREPGLWPTLLAILGHIVVFLTPMLLALYRGYVLAAFPLTPLILGSGIIIRTEISDISRPGRVTAIVLLTWLCAMITAAIAGRTGLF